MMKLLRTSFQLYTNIDSSAEKNVGGARVSFHCQAELSEICNTLPSCNFQFSNDVENCETCKFLFFFTKVRSGGIMHLGFCSPVFASNRVLWFVVLMYLSGDLPQNKLDTCA